MNQNQKLAEEYNKLAKTAGKPTIKRFATIDDGKRRLKELQATVAPAPKKTEKKQAAGLAGVFHARPGTNRERLINRLGDSLNAGVERSSLIKATYGKEDDTLRGALMMVLKGVDMMIVKFKLPYKVVRDGKTIGLYDAK